MILQIVSSRPMYPSLRTTPVAGIRFTEHLKQLILHFGLYHPPLATLGGSANLPSSTQLTRVPEEILTDELVEAIKTECCFIGEPVEIPLTPVPAAPVVPSSDAMSVDEVSVPPSSDAPSESPRPSSPVHPDHQRTTSTLGAGSRQAYWESVAAIYKKNSTTRDMSLKVNPPGIGAPTGRGTLIIPGWVRERAAEVLFEGGDVDESSVAEVVLDCLLRVGYSTLFGPSVSINDWVSGSARSTEDAYLLDSDRWWDCNAAWVDTSTTTGARQDSESTHEWQAKTIRPVCPPQVACVIHCYSQ
jgi:actin-related protein 10